MYASTGHRHPRLCDCLSLLLLTRGGPPRLAPLIGTTLSFWDDGNICSIATRRWRRGIVRWRRSCPYRKPYPILIVPAIYQAPPSPPPPPEVVDVMQQRAAVASTTTTTTTGTKRRPDHNRLGSSVLCPTSIPHLSSLEAKALGKNPRLGSDWRPKGAV
ncbi:uncharacterized protein LY79DRAFT_277973 [Colletotrichum navitas]|uniref:Uncharacterized protein n=1 Tax=Colletotrichum navitas TaxID=681940 RepID=A0AAD8PUS6_9PEZI|nr:uncharacterized protein LY79DRAFT_277973 [Colletotrichum navitas]KAK1585064.1 hypothetical protein LY79DRAFT_277973 [Colletotrichum navitas]